jgi:tRNA nucleotidyltransferase/poly(A) polymerase
MKPNLPSEVSCIINTFEKAGFEIYVVGGAVRDLLMGKLVYDWDFTTNAIPKQMLKLLEDKEAFYTNEFGTVGIPSKEKGERPYEITTFRTEHGYSDARRPDKVKWGKTLEEDLQRRDFTINALALARVKESKSGRVEGKLEMWKKNTPALLLSSSPALILIDQFGGETDLDKKLIRCVGDPNERFSEDALRMMRAVRIAAELGFTIEEKTLQAIQKNAPLINKIAPERVRDELFKILASPYPYEGTMLFRNVGLMAEVIPEMEKTFGVEQKSPGRHHIYDVGTHSMLSLKHVAEKNTDPVVRFATMIHDVGKTQTYKKLDTGVITFYNHELVSGRVARNIAKRLRFSKKQAEKFYLLVRYHQFTVDERQTDSAIRRFIRKVGIKHVPDMLDLRVGDRLGGGARETSWRLEKFKKRLIEVQKQPFTVRDLKITGHDVMKILNIKPGLKVGNVLERLYEEVVEKIIPNEKKALESRIKETVKKLLLTGELENKNHK